MYLLLPCSIIAIALIIERLLFWREARRMVDSGEVDALLVELRKGNASKIKESGHRSHNPIVQALTSALTHGDQTLHDALELEIDKTEQKTRAMLSGLATIVALAPLLGIFGTVTGIIQSFQLLGVTSIADPQSVSGGIAQALITTATGLAIAMPTLIFHNAFSSMSDKFIFRMERYAREFEILYAQRGGRKDS